MPAKRLEFAVSVAPDGCWSHGEAARLHPGADWTPEHLVLGSLARCTLAALDYHCERASLSARGSAEAEGVVTKREEDGRYAFVELACRLDVKLEPAPDEDDVRALLGKAERDCFIGASFTASVTYAWRVNGRDVTAG